nr:hypothetical protein [uncultured Roseateles sp.]
MFAKPLISARRLATLALLLGGLATTVRAAPLGVVTMLEGEATLLRDNARLALAEGVRVGSDDIIELGAKGRFLRVEFDDGASLGLGPDTRAQLAPALKGNPRAYLLRGWAKLSAAKGAPAALASPWFELSGLTRDAVISAQAEGGQVFAEAGELSLRPLKPAGAPITMKGGELLSQLGNAKPETASRPTPAFVQAAPRAFLDSLPPRADKFKGKDLAPKRLADIAYADAQPWIDAEPALRRANLARWKPLARNPEFRKGLAAELKAHPEWEPVLFPPKPASAPKY